jgi:hypothetical protein
MNLFQCLYLTIVKISIKTKRPPDYAQATFFDLVIQVV